MNYMCLRVAKRESCSKDQRIEVGQKEHGFFGAGRGDPL